MILAGDVGGTKTNLALFAVREGRLASVAKQSFSSQRYPDLQSVVREFLAPRRETIDRACFGVAGPVIEGKARTPNLPWLLDAAEISAALALPSLWLINDLEATAYGLLALDAQEFAVLNPGSPRRFGQSALIAAGTGLGEAIIGWEGERCRPLASEGGHADFAPRSAIEIELLRYLMARFGHVSYERVISGPGLVNIYNFLKDSGYFTEPSWLAERLKREDPAAVISEAAQSRRAEICARALDLFVSVYGAEAGNLALKAKAVRGVYVGGGIAPKILDKLRDGTFMRAFSDKGRFRDLLSAIPVRVVLNHEAALLGAAYCGAFAQEA